MKPFDVMAAGYIGADLAPLWPDRTAAASFNEFLRPGSIVEVGGLQIAPGGAVANTGLALHRFGRRVLLNGLVGRDFAGDFIIDFCRRQGVACSIARTDRAATAYGLVIAPPGLDRVFLEHVGCNAVFGADDIDWPAVEESRIFHFGYPPLMRRLYADGGLELSLIFRRARAAGAAVSLDMALPDAGSPAGSIDWPAFMERVLPEVDIFMPGIEELLFTMMPQRYAELQSDGHADIPAAVPEAWYRELGDAVIALGVRVVMIKAGRLGAYIRTGEMPGPDRAEGLPADAGEWSGRSLWIAPKKAEAQRFCNASGAGDAAAAGLLAGLLEGLPPEEAAALAMAAGRDSLYGHDAISGLRERPEMTEDINKNRGGEEDVCKES